MHAPCCAAWILVCAALFHGCGGAEPAPREAAPSAAPRALSADDAGALLETVRGDGPTHGRDASPPVPEAPSAAGGTVVFAARLIDQEFRPLSAGSLALTRPGVSAPEEVARARCDANGSVWLSVPTAELPASPCWLVAQAPGHAHASLVADPPRARTGGIVGLGEVLLAPGGELRGRVVDGDARPVAGAHLVLSARTVPEGNSELRGLHPPLLPASPLCRATTDESGAFVLAGAPVGAWVLVASGSPEGEPRVPVARALEIAAGASTSVGELVLASAEPALVLRGSVRDPAGVPAAHVRLELLEADTARPAGAGGVARADGTFWLLVPRGTRWIVAAHDPEGRFEPVHSAPSTGGDEVALGFSAPVR